MLNILISPNKDLETKLNNLPIDKQLLIETYIKNNYDYEKAIKDNKLTFSELDLLLYVCYWNGYIRQVFTELAKDEYVVHFDSYIANFLEEDESKKVEHAVDILIKNGMATYLQLAKNYIESKNSDFTTYIYRNIKIYID